MKGKFEQLIEDLEESGFGWCAGALRKVVKEARQKFPFTYVNILGTEEEPILMPVDKKYWGEKIDNVPHRPYADPFEAAKWFVEVFGKPEEEVSESE